MKKIITSMLAIITSCILILGIAGCDNKPATSSATAYDVVHGSYLGVVDITVNKDGKVTAIKVDEIFFPESWAKEHPMAKTPHLLMNGLIARRELFTPNI